MEQIEQVSNETLKPFKVLSLFDGISAAQVAINRIGIKNYIYYASEVDKYAITITQANYPNTIQVGDVTQIDGKEYQGIDLLIAGSPCQGFSQAGTHTNFEHPQSKLFWHFVRILEESKPKYFLLENVKMKQEWRDVISKAVKCEPTEINSALVSGQNRKRLYWTNIEKKHEIQDEGIKLGDILEPIPFDADCPNFLKLPIVRKKNGATKKTRGEMVRSINDQKSFTVNATIWKGQNSSYIKAQAKNLLRPCKPREIKKDSLCHHVADACDINGHDILKRIYGKSGKSPTVNAMGGGNVEPKVLTLQENNNYYYRKLSCVELERLQTFDDNYTAHVSKTQRCKGIGNSFTVRIIEEILKDINIKSEL